MKPTTPSAPRSVVDEARGTLLAQALPRGAPPPDDLTARAVAAAFAASAPADPLAAFVAVGTRFFVGATACATLAVIVLVRSSAVIAVDRADDLPADDVLPTDGTAADAVADEPAWLAWQGSSWQGSTWSGVDAETTP